MKYTVNEVAKMTGITLRTLRYYDNIDLLNPSAYTDAGYRLYDEGDLEVLQQILLLRELDFPLKKIAELIHAPDYDRRIALETQEAYLLRCSQRYKRLAELTRETLRQMEGEKKMSNQEMFAGFHADHPEEIQKQYEEEVKQKWGGTEAYKISSERAGGYSKQDWEEIMNVQKENISELAECYQQNIPAADEKVQDVVEKSRLFIDRYFYPCPPEMIGQLGILYISDPRFKRTYDKVAEGLAEYYNEAIQFYCQKKA